MKRFLLLLPILIFTTTSASAQDFKRPAPGYEWSFPRDHANHSDYAVEWWYFTGHLLPEGADPDDMENWINLELTFFRNSLPGEGSGELYFSHFATSGNGQPFAYGEAIARGILGEAGSDDNMMKVWLDAWEASLIDTTFVLEAYDDDVGGIRLTATATTTPVLHGEDGYSPKGPGDAEASYYYSLPFIDATGWYLPGADENATSLEPIKVTGRLWMDHEFGNQQLGGGLVGWDWWGLELPGGDALMFYRIRRGDGEAIPQSEGTFIGRDGRRERIHLDQITIEPTGSWTSEASGATYPFGWSMTIPSKKIELNVTPLYEDQELRTDGSTRVTYYEGAVEVTRKGVEGSTLGFVEMVGYDR
ncbi:hypothetical protein KQI63_13615 [bacterium]|nr:hypothetical protein [bacterium]